jgi:hypothetical protein
VSNPIAQMEKRVIKNHSSHQAQNGKQTGPSPVSNTVRLQVPSPLSLSGFESVEAFLCLGYSQAIDALKDMPKIRTRVLYTVVKALKSRS